MDCLLTHPGCAMRPQPQHPQTPAQRYEAARALTLALAAPLGPEDCQAQSLPECNPVKWHLAHTTCFFETLVLARIDTGRPPFHPRYHALFSAWDNAAGLPRAARGLLTRPGLDEVLRYRAHVDAAMHALLAHSERLPPEFLALTELGIQHERQHQEAMLADAKHLLGCNPLRPAYAEGAPPGPPPASPPMGWVRYAGGPARLGHEGDGFAFDSERPAHDVLLPPFYLADRLVTQGEYLEFMLDGGYRRPELWLALGWETALQAGWKAPLYWEGQKRDWQIYTLRGMQPPDPHAPVIHVSYFEADAYARWARVRLPRESEWEHAAKACNGADAGRANLLESGRLHPCPAPARTHGVGAPGQLYGDAWEWTSSAYEPYPGHAPAPGLAGAVGEYGGRFMCGQYVLRGGACITPRDLARPSYRHALPPHARWHFTGIRLARDG